jgi:hypothetical protein
MGLDSTVPHQWQQRLRQAGRQAKQAGKEGREGKRRKGREAGKQKRNLGVLREHTSVTATNAAAAEKCRLARLI